MKLSLILIEKELKGLSDYLKECNTSLKNITDELEIIVVTPNEIKGRVSKLANYVYCKNQDYQQLVMAGVDTAQFDNVLIANSSYKINLLVEMVKERLNGAELVCVKPKASKFKKFFVSIAQGFYNLILRAFGRDLFTIGILKDIQLISGETLDLIKNNQAYAHRIRTIYSPLQYQTKFIDLSLQEIDNSKNQWLLPKLNAKFYISSVLSFLSVLCLIGGIIACFILNAGIVAYFLLVFLTLLFGFVSSSVVVNCIAKTKIGLLHEQDKLGKIYTKIDK